MSLVGFLVPVTVAFLWSGSRLPADAQAAILDGVVARVGSRVIMVSDLRLARGLRLVDETATDDAVVTYLVNRGLMLGEVARFQPPDPPVTAVDAALDRLRARVGPNWQGVLGRSGVDEAYVRAFATDTLRIDTYRRQRFAALAEPTEEDLRAAYEQRRKAYPADIASSFETLRSSLRDDLVAERYEVLTAEWIAELRARGDVSIRDVPSADIRPKP
jgi:hypothetical protein